METKCSLNEEMLMWTSYRYCIGRKTYVVSLANYIARKYYSILSDQRLEFTAEDIRNEIYDKLRWLPFDFKIHRWTDKEKFLPIDYLLTFINREKINSVEEFCSIAKLEYHVKEDKFEFEKKTPTIKDYFNFSDIKDLLPWNDLAACFDKSCHKMVTLTDGTITEAFPSWKEKMVPVENKKGYYTTNGCFGYTPVWKSVNDFIKGFECRYILPEAIKKCE